MSYVFATAGPHSLGRPRPRPSTERTAIGRTGAPADRAPPPRRTGPHPPSAHRPIEQLSVEPTYRAEWWVSCLRECKHWQSRAQAHSEAFFISPRFFARETAASTTSPSKLGEGGIAVGHRQIRLRAVG